MEHGEGYPDWIRTIDARLSVLRSRKRTCRVPSKFQAIKQEAYTPQIVAIGPFHRDKPEVQAMEELKWRYMLGFVDRVVKSNTEIIQFGKLDAMSIHNSRKISALNKCSKVISELEKEAREWFAEDINLDEHQFMEMLLLDGCFILELCFRCIKIKVKQSVSTSGPQLITSPIIWEDTFLLAPPDDYDNFAMVNILRSDLLLMENQIPYVILQKLFDIIPVADKSSTELSSQKLQGYIFLLFNSVSMFNYDITKLNIGDMDRKYYHVLDMLYQVSGFKKELGPNYKNRVWGFTRCATELFTSGFQIVCSGNTSTMDDIKFKEGEISIPQVSIDKSCDTLLRNLIALEHTGTGRHTVTSYVKLMTTLIRSKEDAYLLEWIGIIKKSNEVVDVSEFFKSLCRGVDFVDFHFTDLCKQVEKYQVHPWSWRRVKGYSIVKYVEWKESIEDLNRDYFRDRWSLIAFLAASFVILLTFLQTFYTIRAYYPPYH